ncbi:MAG TPA: BBP7 family outer membrane beta-barrel protein [Pirellulales bacterium]|jgi:hypothetical protein|nr:BBP7 family outer membrane beta-barrel protein [Pirellulales bacterium]
MTAYRAWTSLVGVLCLTGTAMAQTNYLEANDPYGVRLTKLDYSSQPSPAYSYNAGAPSQPTVANASVRAPDSAAAPQSAPATASNNAYDNALNNSGWGGDCNECNIPFCCCNDTHWFAYAGGLVMGRSTANHFYTTFDQTNPANQVQYFPGADWGGGVDTRIGYWFGCGSCGNPSSCCNSCGPSGRFGVEADYWGVWGMNNSASITDASVGLNQLGTVQNDGFVGFLAPDDASAWFDNAHAVVLRRSDDVNNVEVNFLYMPCCDTCNRFQMTALAGIRYFRFTDNLEWDQFAGTGLPAGEPNEAIVNDNITNNLIGFQIGAYLNYQICNRVGVFAIPKIGIFGNHITGFNSMALSDGTQATFDNNGDALNFHNSANVFSMLGSIDVGVNWAFSNNWSFIGGYRVVMVSGVALADNQIPQFFADEAGWKTIKSNGDLIMDGAFAGIQARF